MSGSINALLFFKKTPMNHFFKLATLLAAFFLSLLPTQAEIISEEEAWKLGWPTMQGPYGNFRAARTGVTVGSKNSADR